MSVLVKQVEDKLCELVRDAAKKAMAAGEADGAEQGRKPPVLRKRPEGNNGVYNINPTAMIPKTDIGYRKYKDFVLDKDDVANLIFKYGNNDINTFLNLVDNQININGLVNPITDNGRPDFVRM